MVFKKFSVNKPLYYAKQVSKKDKYSSVEKSLVLKLDRATLTT